MSSDNDEVIRASREFNKRQNEVLQRELEEANSPRNRYQKQLDAWWELQREFDEPSDEYMVGGYMERWSQTPSFTKGRRDRDWRIK
jgi:hypothetical protein